MSTSSDQLPLIIAIALLLLLLNVILTVMTFAYDTVNRSRVGQMIEEQEGSRKAERVEALLNKPFRYKFTNIFLGCALLSAGVILIWSGAWSGLIARIIASVVYMILFVLGSILLPAKAAVQHSTSAALAFSGLQTLLNTVLLPITTLMRLPVDLILWIFRQKTDIDPNSYSEEDVMSILEEGQKKGDIMEEGRLMISSIFRFDDELAYEIMTPRTDVFLIDIDDPQEEYMEGLMELRYTRIPVCEGDPDNIIGILNLKDYFHHARTEGFEHVDIRSILRKPYLVPDTKNIAVLFMEMQKDKQHIAVLIDEYGGFSGIVTMEDILEEIVGDIDDEYDIDDEPVDRIDENTWIVEGTMYLEDLNSEVGTSLESDTSETIGGFLIDLMGEIPEDGYTNLKFRYGDVELTILTVKEHRVERVRVHRMTAEEKERAARKKRTAKPQES